MRSWQLSHTQMGDSEATFEMPKEKGTEAGDHKVPLRSAHVIPSIFQFESNTSAFALSPLNLVSLWVGYQTYSALKIHKLCKQATPMFES